MRFLCKFYSESISKELKITTNSKNNNNKLKNKKQKKVKEVRSEMVNTYLPHFDTLNKLLRNLLKSINPHKKFIRNKRKEKVLYY